MASDSKPIVGLRVLEWPNGQDWGFVLQFQREGERKWRDLPVYRIAQPYPMQRRRTLDDVNAPWADDEQGEKAS